MSSVMLSSAHFDCTRFKHPFKSIHRPPGLVFRVSAASCWRSEKSAGSRGSNREVSNRMVQLLFALGVFCSLNKFPDIFTLHHSVFPAVIAELIVIGFYGRPAPSFYNMAKGRQSK